MNFFLRLLGGPILLSVVLLPVSMCPQAAHAQPIDFSHGGPVDVTAADGIDWLQNEQEVIARGDARAVRGDVTVTADQLIAHYRKKGTGPNGTPPPPVQQASTKGPAAPGDDTEGNEIYRLDAIGHVHIFTPTDQAWGDHAVYDIDQAVLVMTGGALKVQTPQDIMTARDSMEYWSQRHIAVGRGNAVVITADGRRLQADTLVGYTTPTDQPATPPNAPPGATPAAAHPAAPAKPNANQDPLMASGKLQKVEAFGNVIVRTATETVYGDRGVYVPDTGIARIVGHVRITRGQNQVNGVAAIVNMKTGISTMISGHDERVHGLIVPTEAQQAAGGTPKPAQKPEAKPEAKK